MTAAEIVHSTQERVGLSAAQPTVFGNQAGLFTAAGAGTAPKGFAVLFLSPWGLEEFLTRKFYRYLSEKFAEIGIASLRFDYPGTGNAIDDAEEGISAWLGTVQGAVTELKSLAGVSRVLLLGQGIGAGLAYQHAINASDIAGMALLAPVFKGRAYLRELRVWSNFVNDGLGLRPEDRVSDPGNIAGFEMPPQVVLDLKGFNLTETRISNPCSVFLARKPEGVVDEAVKENLVEAGCIVQETVYQDFSTLLSENSPPELPKAFAAELVTWVKSLPDLNSLATTASKRPLVNPVSGSHFKETPVRFGENNRLIGTLCEPLGNFVGVTAVILSTSYDYQIGWARANVQLSRELAAKGIATFRYDGAGIGDSPAVPGRRAQVLYDEKQVDDAELAFELVKSLGLAETVVVVGRCSGAYAAFRTALRGSHWKGCITINPYGFYWRFVGLPKPLKEYLALAKDPSLIKRVVGGQVNLRAAATNVFYRAVDRVAERLQKILPAAPTVAQRNDIVHAEFDKLAKLGTSVTIIYSEEDIAMEAFLINFGKDSEKLNAFSNVNLQFVANSDHNLTPKPAREKAFDIVAKQLLALVPDRAA
ncbi:MAG: alpha/beta hydrolase family protein [Pseudomonadota bacterium]